MIYFPDNTTTRFVTQLPRELRLQGEWAVSLVEIEYPMTFFHVPYSENFVTFTDGNVLMKAVGDDLLIPTPPNDDPYTVLFAQPKIESDIVPHGVYRSVDTLLDTINKLPCVNKHVRFECSPGGQVEVRRICTDGRYHDMSVSPAIAKILGFPTTTSERLVIKPRGRYIGERPASLTNAIPNSMFVYSDICTSYITGDVQTPLLRVVPVEYDNSVYGSSRIKSFSAARYIPLVRNNIQTIEIDIRDEYGRLVPFEHGTLTATLHFKRFH